MLIIYFFYHQQLLIIYIFYLKDISINYLINLIFNFLIYEDILLQPGVKKIKMKNIF
jgi:hypothetical protein